MELNTKVFTVTLRLTAYRDLKHSPLGISHSLPIVNGFYTINMTKSVL